MGNKVTWNGRGDETGYSLIIRVLNAMSSKEFRFPSEGNEKSLKDFNLM